MLPYSDIDDNGKPPKGDLVSLEAKTESSRYNGQMAPISTLK